MHPRSFSWLGFRSVEERDLLCGDPSLAQEDEETRASINHYLRLAGQLLSTDHEETLRQKDDDEAA